MALLISHGDLLTAGFDLFVIRLDVTHLLLSQQTIAPLHFINRPLEGTNGLLRLNNNRGQEVRNIGIWRHLHLLGVDEAELHFAGTVAVEQAGEERVDHH